MTRASAALLLAAAALTAGRAAIAEVALRAVDDSVRVDPVRAVIIEGGAPLAPRGPAPGYLEGNPVFDLQGGRIQLQAARNETVAFQVVVLVPAAGVRRLGIAFEGLEGPSPLSRPRHITIYRQWYVQLHAPSSHLRAEQTSTLADTWFPVGRYEDRLVTSLGAGFYPDALIPLDGPDGARLPGLPMAVPSLDNPVPGQRAQSFWVDVRVPRDATPGDYRGRIVVDADGESHHLEVELAVLPVTLPEELHAGLGSVSYDFVGVHLAGLGVDPLHRFFRQMRRHRLTVDPLYLHPEWQDGQVDWSSYDALVGPLIDGSAFSAEAGFEGAGQGRAVRRFVLPVDWNWPLAPDAPGYEEAFRSALRACEEHLLGHGGSETEWSLFINTTDEPRTEEVLGLVRRYGELLESSGVARDRIRYRLDAGPFKSIGEELPGWSLERIFEDLGPHVDIWNACGAVGNAPAAAMESRLAVHPDESAWVYFSNAAGEPAMGSVLIDGEALGARTWGWIAWRYGLSAVVSWEVGWPDQGCLEEPSCAGFGLHGDASLVYLAGALGAPDVTLPSVRLKGLRRGAEDYEYLWLLRQAGHGALADGYARRLVPHALDDGVVEGSPGAWDHDPAQWERVRREMGLVLAGRMSPPSLAAVARGAPVPERPPLGLTRRKSLFWAAGLLVVLCIFGLRPEGLFSRGRPRPAGPPRRS